MTAQRQQGRETYPAPVARQDRKPLNLSGVCQQAVEGLNRLKFVAVGRLLALDTVGRPGHRIQALRADLLFAVETGPVGSVRNASESGAYVPQQVRFAVQVADCKFPLSSKLDFVQRVGRLLDGD